MSGVSGGEAVTVRLPGDRGAPADGGLVLDRYRLRRQLGAGAFGVVWLARDERLGRDVAVKAIPLERASARAEREARAAARLSNPAIVRLYEAAIEDGTTYLVSELVRGATLAELLADGALSDRDIAAIGIALCQALAHAHAHGVVHRDVKPSNVLVPEAPADGDAVAKLTDFGVARIVEGEGAEHLTRTGDVIGTLAYMAPEQAEGRPAEAPADLYAAALVLYEALSGINPVRGGTAVATARRLGAPLPPLGRQRGDLPPRLCDAIDRALAPRPRDRGTVADLHRALAAELERLDDAPGHVEAPTVERLATAATAVVERTRAGWRRRSREEELAAVAAELGVAGAGAPVVDDGAVDPARRAAPPPVAPRRSRIAERVAAAVGGGGALAAGLAAVEGATAVAPPDPRLAGLAAAGAIALLPRLGWLATVALTLGWLAGPGQAPGVALVVAAGLAAIPPLLPFSPRAWSLPLAAPALGVALLAGAYPALAGQARTVWRRAALGALGFWALALAEPLAGRALAYGAVRGTAPLDRWAPSPRTALEQVVQPLLASGALATAALWAAGAAVLPWLVRGRHAALDLVAATVWAAALAAGTGALGAPLDGRVPHPEGRGAALGAAVAVLVAVGARTIRTARARAVAGREGGGGR